jgi:hypothetical protein
VAACSAKSTSGRRKDVLVVEQWAELRRLHFVQGVSPASARTYSVSIASQSQKSAFVAPTLCSILCGLMHQTM